jgi:hypothetical protein
MADVRDDWEPDFLRRAKRAEARRQQHVATLTVEAEKIKRAITDNERRKLLSAEIASYTPGMICSTCGSQHWSLGRNSAECLHCGLPVVYRLPQARICEMVPA